MAGAGAFGIDVPDGDPGALEAAAADLRSVAGVIEGVGTSLGGASSIPGWTGDASFQYASRCVTHRDVVASAQSAMDAAARVLAELADELRAAIRQAKAAVEAARAADERRRAAEKAAASARASEQAATERGEGLAGQADAHEAAGHPAPEARFDSELAFGEARAAAEEAARAESRARRAAEELEEAKREGHQAVERYERYGDQAAHVIGALSGIAPAVVLPAPPPQAAAGPDHEGGNALDGLGKGLGDLWGEAKGLVGGAANHVNVFNPDKLADTWSRDYQVVGAVVSDPVGSAKQWWAGTTAPIVESYRTGGKDEAGARAVPALGAAILGGKGLSKLGKVGSGRGASDAPPVRPGDSLRRLYGAEEDLFGTVPSSRYDAAGKPIPEGAAPLGRSWTPMDISDLGDARKELGLPRGNPARFFIEARVVDPTGMRLKPADPLHGNPGGAPEVVVPDPARQLEITRVEGVNPEP